MARMSPKAQDGARNMLAKVGQLFQATNTGLNKTLGPVGAAAVMGAVTGGESPEPPETYYESAKNVPISKARAIREVKNHGANPGDFLKEMGDKGTYMAHHVLDWLGY